MCIDFTDLNKAYLKDLFPIPKIDQLVDAIVGHPRMSFLDTFQGYHQIPLALDDQEKTAFIIPIGNYHYKVMSFGVEKRKIHLSENDDKDVRVTIGEKYHDLYR